MIDIVAQTKHCQKKILFCEPDKRILQAVQELKRHGIQPILLGTKEQYETHGDIAGIEILPITDAHARAYYARRKHKGISLEDAQKASLEPMTHAILLLAEGKVDGVVAGASWPTSQTLKPALQLLKKDFVSSYFLINAQEQTYLFTDCAMNIAPSAEELVHIAKNAAREAEKLGIPARIGMLSFSTLGSAQHKRVSTVAEATQKLVQEGYDVEGEIQADAALNPAIAEKKGGRGNATILVFPNLDAANIGYKLVQHFGKVELTGPLLSGLQRPVTDLSRGASTEEIIRAGIYTAYQSMQ